MTLDRKIDANSVIDNFGDRNMAGSGDSIEVKQINVDRAGLTSYLKDRMSRIATLLFACKKGDRDNHVLRDSNLRSERKPLQSTPAFGDVGVSIEWTHDTYADDYVHSSGIYPPFAAGEERESIAFECTRYHRTLGEFIFRYGPHVPPNEWQLVHRAVDPDYRGNGIGSVMLDVSEEFVRECAQMRGVPQKMTANVAQPKLMVILLNRGYIAATQVDQDKIDRVLASDPDLALAHAISKYTDGGSYTETGKDLYCFEEGAKSLMEVDALRINLVKVINPVHSHVDASRHGFAEKAQGVMY